MSDTYPELPTPADCLALEVARHDLYAVRLADESLDARQRTRYAALRDYHQRQVDRWELYIATLEAAHATP